MAKIIRCKNCQVEVYKGAATCHRCGADPAARRRILRRKGTVAVILGAVVIFAAGDAIYLLKEKKNRHREAENSIVQMFEAVLRPDQRSLTVAKAVCKTTFPFDQIIEEIRTEMGPGAARKKLRVEGIAHFESCDFHPGIPPDERDHQGQAERYRFTIRIGPPGDERIIPGEACIRHDPYPTQLCCLTLAPDGFPDGSHPLRSGVHLPPDR